jgi:putative transposase
MARPAGAAVDNLLMNLGDRVEGFKFLIRDRDAKVTAGVDTVLAAQGVRIIKAPVRAPRANAIAGRWIARARREGLDQMLITGERQLRLIPDEHAGHDTCRRPHRALHQGLPGVRIHPLRAQMSGFCTGTGSAA